MMQSEYNNSIDITTLIGIDYNIITLIEKITNPFKS